MSARRAAGVAAVGAIVFLAANWAAWMTAVHWDLQAAIEPAALVSTADLGWLRASLGFDLCGYVLLLPPLWALRTEFHGSRTTLADSAFAGGLLYVIAVVFGIAALSAAWPPLFAAYAAASGPDRVVLAAVFSSITELVYLGLWNVAAALGIAVWAGCTAVLVGRRSHALRLTGFATAASAVADAGLVLAGAGRGQARAQLVLILFGTAFFVLVASKLLSTGGGGDDE